jgi:hypothetical protein
MASTATNRGPITTIFTPASSCLYNTIGSPNTQFQGIIFELGHLWGDDGIGCYPSASTLTDPENDWNTYYYSPAICPSGCNTATLLISVSGGPAMGPGTSGYLCCPL